MKGIGNKGMSNAMVLILLFIGIVFAGSMGYILSQYAVPTRIKVAPVSYDGEFQDGGIPEDASGTDLQVENAYAEDDDNATMVLNTTSRICENTSATTEYWAYMLETDDAVKSFKIEATFDPNSELTATATDNYDLKKVYILEDSEDFSVMDEEDALYKCTVDNDDEEFECDISVLPEGQYVAVLVMRIIDPEDGDLAATFYKIEHDFSGGDRDKLDVYIEN